MNIYNVEILSKEIITVKANNKKEAIKKVKEDQLIEILSLSDLKNNLHNNNILNRYAKLSYPFIYNVVSKKQY